MKHLKKLNQSFLALPIWLRLIISALTICLILIVTQNFQIFPKAVFSIFNSRTRDPKDLPPNVESIFITTEDAKRLELWRLPSSSNSRVAIVFHGNAGDVRNFFPYQQYLESIGITSYGFDYRGYGKSTGWPSEQGLYKDARAVVSYIMKRENIGSEQLIFLGVSIGGGAAAHAATEFNVGTLVLLSPFTSLPNAIKATPLFGFLDSFSFYEFPVEHDVKQLDNTCFIVAHGEKDNVIPFSQGQEVFRAYKGSRFSSFIASPDASHNDVLFKIYGKLTKAIASCENVK